VHLWPWQKREREEVRVLLRYMVLAHEFREAELLKKRHSVLAQRNEIIMRLLHSISQDPKVNPGTRREIAEVFSGVSQAQTLFSTLTL
jgi:hypothetical protein